MSSSSATFVGNKEKESSSHGEAQNPALIEVEVIPPQPFDDETSSQSDFAQKKNDHGDNHDHQSTMHEPGINGFAYKIKGMGMRQSAESIHFGQQYGMWGRILGALVVALFGALCVMIAFFVLLIFAIFSFVHGVLTWFSRLFSRR